MNGNSTGDKPRVLLEAAVKYTNVKYLKMEDIMNTWWRRKDHFLSEGSSVNALMLEALPGSARKEHIKELRKVQEKFLRTCKQQCNQAAPEDEEYESDGGRQHTEKQHIAMPFLIEWHGGDEAKGCNNCGERWPDACLIIHSGDKREGWILHLSFSV